MPDKEERLEEPHLQSSHLPNGREIDEGDTVFFDRRLARTDCQLPDWDIPDAAYRPVPIVWFFSAWLAQLVTMTIAFRIGVSLHYYLSIALCLVLTILVGRWTWERGMNRAGRGWKIATLVMLAGQFACAALLGFAMVQAA